MFHFFTLLVCYITPLRPDILQSIWDYVQGPRNAREKICLPKRMGYYNKYHWSDVYGSWGQHRTCTTTKSCMYSGVIFVHVWKDPIKTYLRCLINLDKNYDISHDSILVLSSSGVLFKIQQIFLKLEVHSDNLFLNML